MRAVPEYQPARHAAQVRSASRGVPPPARTQAGFSKACGRFLSCFVLLILALNIPLYLLCIFLPCPRSAPALEFPIRLAAIGTLVLASHLC